ncbi:MAG: DUF503 domain-containing protein [Synergistaceae bacterium]|nr:DUF503 domain-containing protein [Synergistaceae bacterium]
MPHWIAAGECALSLYCAATLKDRRHVVKSLIDGARSRFNVSYADVSPKAEDMSGVRLGFAACGSARAELEERMRNLEKYLSQREENDGEFELIDFTWEVIAYGDLSYTEDQ